MNFLILNTDYPEFLRWLYTQHPGLENAPYEEQIRARTLAILRAGSMIRRIGGVFDER